MQRGVCLVLQGVSGASVVSLPGILLPDLAGSNDMLIVSVVALSPADMDEGRIKIDCFK